RSAGQGASQVLRDTASTEKAKAAATETLSKINDEVIAYQKNIITTHKDKFVGIMLGLTVDPELPDHPRDASGAITDSNFVYQYYINHYWDNVNLKDPRIVNTPVFHNKLDKYFSKKGLPLM